VAKLSDKFSDIIPDAQPNGTITTFSCKKYEEHKTFCTKYVTVEPIAAIQDSVEE
jgi:hypothetical protein